MDLKTFYALSLLAVLIAFAFAAYLFLWVKRQKTENKRIIEVSELIKAGANTFLRKEYRILVKNDDEDRAYIAINKFKRMRRE